MMKRIGAFVTMLLALTVAFSPVAAQENPNVYMSYVLEAEPGHDADLASALKAQVKWYGENAETWHWHAWQILTGEDTGKIVFRSPNHFWKDMDDRAERAVRATAHFKSTVGQHLKSINGSVGVVLQEQSNWPADRAVPSMVTVIEFTLHFGMAEQFAHTIGKLHEVMDEGEWPLEFAWLAAVTGDEIPSFRLVLPRDGWADLQGPEKPFWAMMEEAVGRPDADALRAGLHECVREQSALLARFRPDLSYVPSED